MMREALREIEKKAYDSEGASGSTEVDRWFAEIGFLAKKALAAEPTQPVRLTEKELLKAYTTAENQKLVWQVDRERYLRHAKIVMGAMERKNRGAE